jgi:hypothetical protein
MQANYRLRLLTLYRNISHKEINDDEFDI